MSNAHDYYGPGGDPELHNRGEGRRYIEPDYLAQEADDQLPMISTLGCGPRGHGVYPHIVKSADGEFLWQLVDDVTGEAVMDSPNLSAGKIEIVQPDRELLEGEEGSFDVRVVRGKDVQSYTVKTPAGSHGSRIYLLGGVMTRRADETYTCVEADLTVYGGRWSDCPSVRPGDIVVFSLKDSASRYLAFGTVQKASPAQVAFTSRTRFEWRLPYIGGNGNWFVEDQDTGVSAQGPQGPAGEFGPVVAKTLPAGSRATAKNLSSDPHVLNLEVGIPQGYTGNKATFSAPTAHRLDQSQAPTVEDLDPDPSNAKLDFGIPDGKKAIVKVTPPVTLPAGSNATVGITENTADNSYTIQFGIPEGERGLQGEQGSQGIPGADGLTPSVNEVEQVNGNISITLDDIPDGTVRSISELAAATNAAMEVATSALSKRRADTLYANALIGNAQGDMVHVEDAWEADAVGLLVMGKSVQDGTPTPDAPIEVDVVDSPVSVQATGKNLLRYPYATSTNTTMGITFTSNADGSVSVSGTATSTAFFDFVMNANPLLLAQGTYKFSVNTLGGARIYLNKSGNVTLGQITDTKTETSIVIGAGEGIYGGYLAVDAGTAINATIYPQLELGSTATAYEPYTSNQQTITLPSDHNYLASLPDGTRDELVLRADGVAVLTERVGKVVVTGAYFLGTTGAGHKYVTTSPVPDSTGSSTITFSAMIYSDRYNYRLPAGANNNTAYRTWNSLIIIDDRFADLATAGAILAAERPTVYYELATPATSYSADNGATWSTIDPAAGNSAIQLYKGTNNVWCTDALSPEVALDYVQDTNAVINELRAAIVASGATN